MDNNQDTITMTTDTAMSQNSLLYFKCAFQKSLDKVIITGNKQIKKKLQMKVI